MSTSMLATFVSVPAIIVATTWIIAVIIAILRLSGVTRRSYPKNKCERQKSPANPFTKFFHVHSFLPCCRTMATPMPARFEA
jgi:hypothetical protein